MFSRLFLLSGSFAILTACVGMDPNKDLPKVAAIGETDAVGTMSEDAADDPAVWINFADKTKSVVLGTDKKAGLYSYDLTGKTLQFLPSGNLNNVDLRQGIVFDQLEPVDLAAATNRTINGVSLFSIDADGKITEAGQFSTPTLEPYGLCVGYDESGFRVFVTYKTGEVEIYEVVVGKGGYEGDLLNTLKLETQLEGCSYDEVQNVLFVGEEGRGLWRFDLNGNEEFSRTLLDSIGSETGLVGDVEGVDIWRGEADSGYVVVSAQGGDRYVVYTRAAPNSWVGTFAISETEDGLIDGVSHTDGLAISSADLGGALEKGILVVQDDSNGDKGLTQNFKYVAWADIVAALEK